MKLDNMWFLSFAQRLSLLTAFVAIFYTPYYRANGESLASQQYRQVIGENEGKCLLSSSGLIKTPGITIIECSLECYRLLGCTTFNYRQATKTCEVTATPFSAAFGLVAGCVLYETVCDSQLLHICLFYKMIKFILTA